MSLPSIRTPSSPLLPPVALTRSTCRRVYAASFSRTGESRFVDLSSLCRAVKPHRQKGSPSEVGRNKLAKVPLVEWCAPEFKPNKFWRIADGEASIEAQVQRQRELKVFEAVYSRASAIPPNPTVSPDATSSYDDSRTPSIPLTPIRDEGPSSNAQNNPASINKNGEPESLINPQPPPKDTNHNPNSLIQQHGEESPKEKNNTKPDESMKPCIFFHTPKGCNRGANCPSQHGSFVVGGSPSYKRMKVSKD